MLEETKPTDQAPAVESSDLLAYLTEKYDAEPKPDMAHCSSCGWSGNRLVCETEQEGDYESGYYAIDLCPKCDDGGCVDDYSMTKERAAEWNKWYSSANV